MGEKSAAEGMLTGALGNLMAVAENYPQLKANEDSCKLQGELGDMENKIAAARRFLNNAVAEYNSASSNSRRCWSRGRSASREAQMFTLDAAEREQTKNAPKVRFS